MSAATCRHGPEQRIYGARVCGALRFSCRACGAYVSLEPDGRLQVLVAGSPAALLRLLRDVQAAEDP